MSTRNFVKDAFVILGSESHPSTSSSLLGGLRAHDRHAWNRLVELYGPLIYSWCRGRGLQSADAADVVQEVFRSVARGVQDFRPAPTGSFRGWLWTIARNRILDFFRRRQREPNALGGERVAEIPERLEDSEQGSSAAGNLVRRALAMIRPDFSETTWQAFWRVVMEDQPTKDVARDLAMTVNALYIAKSRILRRLREALGEDCLE